MQHDNEEINLLASALDDMFQPTEFQAMSPRIAYVAMRDRLFEPRAGDLFAELLQAGFDTLGRELTDAEATHLHDAIKARFGGDK